MSSLKIGLISFAHVHAATYAKLLRNWPGVDLLCTDRVDAELPGEIRGRQAAEELDVPYCDTLAELLAWKPDGVIVCTENARHLEPVLAAARAGCHVLCEKPLATRVEDAEIMVKTCQDEGVFLMVSYPVRFSEDYAALSDAVSSGALGEVIGAMGTNNGKIPVESRAWFTDPSLSGGGALVDHVVHVADLLDGLLGGAEATRVFASTNQILHAEREQVKAETGGIVTITYPGGVVATIDCSWSQPDSAPTWGGLTLSVFGSGGSASMAPFSRRIGGYRDNPPGSLWIPVGENLDRTMLSVFLTAIQTGEHPQPDGQVGLRTLRIVKAAQESARTNRVVDLREPETACATDTRQPAE